MKPEPLSDVMRMDAHCECCAEHKCGAHYTEESIRAAVEWLKLKFLYEMSVAPVELEYRKFVEWIDEAFAAVMKK